MRAALQDRPYRTVAKAAKISAAYISDMVQGRIPKREIVISFAEATGADVNELLRLAGYAPLAEAPEKASEDDYNRRFAQLYREMKERLAAEGVPTPTGGAGFGGSQGLTPEDAEAEIRELERVLRELAGKPEKEQ